MTAASPAAAPPKPSLWQRVRRILVWIGGLAIAGLVCELLGIDISGWISQLWDTLTEISAEYIVLGVFFQTLQTVFTALAWVAILRAAYPDPLPKALPIVTCYAVSVAMNGVLPANIGTFTMLFMFLAIVPGSTFTGIFTGYLVQKIFFTIVGGLVYLYLFLSVGGSFDLGFGGLKDHWVLALAIAAGVVVGIVILVRRFKVRARKFWENAKEGATILRSPKAYFGKVFLPETIGYGAKLAVIAVFLAAYGIPVTFHSVMSVVGSNSIANMTSVTPGGIGVNQALNSLALENYTDSATATAYSLGQQLITTAWNLLFAIALVAYVFGWQGGKQLVETSYGQAKEKVAETQEERRRKKEAKREESEAEGPARVRRSLRRGKADQA
jgi:uncharacterized membrane protein YbhN (UPF0104 family)